MRGGSSPSDEPGITAIAGAGGVAGVLYAVAVHPVSDAAFISKKSNRKSEIYYNRVRHEINASLTDIVSSAPALR